MNSATNTPTSIPEIPLGLRNAIESGNCTLFLGAGIGHHMHLPDGRQAPTGPELAQEMADDLGLDCGDAPDLARIAKIVELRKGRVEMETFLKTRLADLKPDDKLLWLLSFRWNAIFTTNYDSGIERGYSLLPEPQQKPVPVALSSEMVATSPLFDVPVYHLHGMLFGPRKPHIVITTDDYATFREQRRMMFERMKLDHAIGTFLYIGYSNRDPNWQTVISEIQTEFMPSRMPRAYRITPDADALDTEILREKNVDTLSMSLADFHQAGSTALKRSPSGPERLAGLKERIPAVLQPAFSQNPAPVVRLLDSWEYVNAAPFSETPNIADFLKGDRPNWSLVGDAAPFQRDIEDDVYDEMLDYATDDRAVAKALLILAPAGYGTTTLLMVLAARLVKEGVEPVFFLKPGHPLLEGDVEFASGLVSGRALFFIDNAADHCEALVSVQHRLKEMARPGMFVLGERLNEWRQTGTAPRCKEFEIDSLSDSEIRRLLSFLSTQGSLGHLEPLNPDMRFAIIRKNFQKELLVAMREATEGRSFDAIIEDEFRGIGNDLSRELYLTVCCFHQYGAIVRDKLLARLLETPLEKIYQETAKATEKVVVFELLDQRTGEYTARARHRTIAAVVWQRCGDGLQRDRLLQVAMESLNLTYHTDREAFERFYLSDHLVDSIHGMEARTRFFETACRKDPESPYVRQHYARMLSRCGRYDAALGQIDQALGLCANANILYHTKGVILSHLALETQSRDIARRRLAQSESMYQRALHSKDHYSFQGLAGLYFGWAKRQDTPEDESAEYLAKAEEVIATGLRTARNKDSLWIESSKIQDYLGDQPSKIKALEKAVSESSGSSIARYLLGRAYRCADNASRAIDVLTPAVKQYPDEYQLFIEYAKSLRDLGKPYSEGIAILRLSTLYGLADARFIATYGGMLFMNGDFTEADKVFEGAKKKNFSAKAMNTVWFQPHDDNDRKRALRLQGEVSVVKAGYSLIDAAGYPRLLCPASKYQGTLLRYGLSVSVELGFSARGPVALAPLAAG